MRRYFCLTILSIVALLTVVSCAFNDGSNAGRINGVNISNQDFVASYRGHFENFMQEHGRKPDMDEKEVLYQNTWNDITKFIILKSYFKKYHISVTQQEVIDSLIANVPPALKKMSVFNTDGKFNVSLYIQSLNYNTPINLSPYKAQYYEYVIPIQKLKEKLIYTSLISKDELQKIKNIMNSVCSVDVITFEQSDYDILLSDKDIETYYQEHLQDFSIKPYYKVGFTYLPVFVTSPDVAKAKAKADSLFTQLEAGVPFTKLAEQYSMSPSSSNQGNLGFVKLDSVISEFKQELGHLQPGKYSQPILVKDDWYIIQVVEQTKTMVKLREIVIKSSPSQQSIETVREKAVHLIELASELGLATAADEMDMNYHETQQLFLDSLWVDDTKTGEYAMSRIFSVNKGSIIEPIYSSKLNRWFVIQVCDIQKQSWLTLDQATMQIRKILSKDRLAASTMQLAYQWLKANTKDRPIQAKSQGLEVIHIDNLSMRDSLFNIPITKIYYDAVSKYNKKEPPIPYLLNDKVIIPIIQKIHIMDKQLFTDQDAVEFYSKSLDAKWFDRWMEGELKKVKRIIWYNQG